MQEGGQETPRAHGRRRRRDAYPPTRWGWRPSINFPLVCIDRAERRAKKKICELVAHYSLARPGGKREYAAGAPREFAFAPVRGWPPGYHLATAISRFLRGCVR